VTAVTFKSQMRKAAPWAAFALCLTVGVASLPGAALAQAVPQDNAALDEAYNKAFQDLFGDPGNLDKSFRFAELAVQKGNYEAAITSLERMLLVNPDLPRVRLELGVLYFRIGSYQISRTYLQRVKESPNVPPEVLARVETFLEEIDKRLTRSVFSGSIFTGGRYTTNANAGPTSTSVLAAGNAANLGDQFTRQSDYNLFGTVTVDHKYDLQTQRQEFVESSGTFYASEQKDEKQLDIMLGEVSTGIRFPILMDSLEGATMKPYIVGSSIFLQDGRYLTSYGLGMNVTLPWHKRLSTNGTLEFREESFRNDSNRPTASQQSGEETSLRLTTSYLLNERTQLLGQLGVLNQNARTKFNAYGEKMIGGGVARVVPLDGIWEKPVTVALTGQRVISDYRGPNAAVDPNNTRFDKEWRLTLIGSLPLGEDWTAIANVQRNIVDSNQPNFEYNATSVSVGLQYQF